MNVLTAAADFKSHGSLRCCSDKCFMLIFLTFRCLNGEWHKPRSDGESTILPRSKAAREEGHR